MKVIDIKTEGGMVKGKIAFYCDALGVTRQGFYWYLKHKDMPWKYEGIAKKMREIVAEDECNDTYGRCRMYQALKLRYPEDDIPSVPFPVSWTVKMKKKQKETQDILSYHTQAAGCSDKARAKASGGRQPIEECGRTGL